MPAPGSGFARAYPLMSGRRVPALFLVLWFVPQPAQAAGRPAVWPQFQPGMPVQVQFEVRDGKKMAQSVVVTPSPSP